MTRSTVSRPPGHPAKRSRNSLSNKAERTLARRLLWTEVKPVMFRHTAFCITLLTQLWAANARAQDDAGPTPVQVKIQGDSTVDMRIFGREDSPPIAKCTGKCTFWTLPGRYTVYSHDYSTGAQHELFLRVTGFSQYQLIQGNGTLHAVGVGLEVVGVVASVVGLITTLSPALSQICESGCDDQDGVRTITIGLGILGAGVVSGIVGFGLETGYRAKLVPSPDSVSASRRGPHFELGIIPVSAGLGLGATGRF
jgi:hypothetical protein